MRPAPLPQLTTTRRAAMVGYTALATVALSGTRGHAADAGTDELRFPFANGKRHLVPAGAFPQKGEMILQRTRAPLLETPWPVFQKHLFTPNDQAYVRWHMADL